MFSDLYTMGAQIQILSEALFSAASTPLTARIGSFVSVFQALRNFVELVKTIADF
jgi:hypothetical protein